MCPACLARAWQGLDPISRADGVAADTTDGRVPCRDRHPASLRSRGRTARHGHAPKSQRPIRPKASSAASQVIRRGRLTRRLPSSPARTSSSSRISPWLPRLRGSSPTTSDQEAKLAARHAVIYSRLGDYRDAPASGGRQGGGRGSITWPGAEVRCGLRCAANLGVAAVSSAVCSASLTTKS